MSDVINSVLLILVSQGIVVKKGRFTTSEVVAVRDALDSFRVVSVSYSLILRPECSSPRRMVSRTSMLWRLSSVDSEPNINGFGTI